MGLDMYSYAVKESILSESDRNREVDVKLGEDTEKTEVHYWRKHHDLHGWMQNLYFSKGGEDENFNCNNVRLTLEDLDALEKDIRAFSLPNTTGFFFGNNPPDEESIVDDIEFIEKARNYINDGYAVFYDSWW